MLVEKSNIKGRISYNVNLAKYSWFQVGGNADILFEPYDFEDLKIFLQNVDKNIPITVIGGGSNLLIRDGGVEGIVILLKNNLSNIILKNDIIEVECGSLNSKLYNFAKDNNIAGFEFLGTIPGTVGGAIRGNAGCYGSEIKDILLSVDSLDLNGNFKNFSLDECNFQYRKNGLPHDLIFTKAYFKAANKDSKKNIEEKYSEMILKRNTTQPQGVKTCGSTFKNSPEKPAWKIIQELGYQGKEINGAKMSEKHANFMVNTGVATADSLEQLGESIRRDAKEKQNINLEWEIKIIGKK